MTNKPQSKRVLELSIDAEAYAELSKLKPSKVFARFCDLRDDVYLEQVARAMGARPVQQVRNGVEVVVRKAPPVLQR